MCRCFSIKDDIENSGANYVDGPAVVSDNLVTCPHYKWMGQWMNKVIEIYNTKTGCNGFKVPRLNC